VKDSFWEQIREHALSVPGWQGLTSRGAVFTELWGAMEVAAQPIGGVQSEGGPEQTTM